MSSSDDSTVINAAANAILNVSIEKIKSLVKRFNNRDVLFVDDDSIIDLTRDQMKSGEWSLYEGFLKTPRLRVLLRVGLTLRRLENDKEKLSALIVKIHNKYGSDGLHIAEFIQRGLLRDFVSDVVGKIESHDEMVLLIEDLFDNLNNRCTFVKNSDSEEKIVDKVKIRLIANVPTEYLVFAKGSAFDLGLRIRQKLHTLLIEFEIPYKMSSNESEKTLIMILSRNNI